MVRTGQASIGSNLVGRLCDVFLIPAATPGAFDHIIVNDDVEEAYQKLKEVVMQVWSSTHDGYLTLRRSISTMHNMYV